MVHIFTTTPSFKETPISVISCSSHPELALKIIEHLKISLEDVEISRFADKECNIYIKNSLRNKDVFVIQTGCNPVNDHIMELLLMVHTLKNASAGRITVIMPYYPYCRQDRKVKPRTPISASLVAQLIEAVGPDHLVTMDLHCGQIQGFFHNIPVDNLYPDNLFMEYLKEVRFQEMCPNNLVIVSPDAGGVSRAKRIADRMGGVPVITILKRRVEANQIESMDIIGNVKNKNCIIIDDIVDTAGTLCRAINLLKDKGCLKVYACITHGILSDPAMKRLNATDVEEIAITNTLPLQDIGNKSSKIKILDISLLLAHVIHRIHHHKPLSELFDFDSRV